ncbi:ferredoxin-NADP reductase [Mycolicibacterium sp. BK556]|nr:ferredoxin-NADP reductase [Mycolicibacterium sp. BK556]MBB3632605.1 ferredoxin-NADP reductase [Mycolicibacterium sp. BK607]
MPNASVHEFTADLVVLQRYSAASDVAVLTLADPGGEDLPRWQPGAHIDLVLEDGLTRQYSLCGDPLNSEVWRVAVLLEPNGRGGSRYVHENLNEGAVVRVRGPRNHFPLVDARRYRFIAGGIGITPIVTMLETCHRVGGDWTLLYGGRTRESMAFAAGLLERFPDRVTVWPQDEHGLLDLDPLLSEPEDGTAIYCCGPEALLTAVEQQSAHWRAGSLHVERFAARAAADDAAGLDHFQVVCQRSGVTLEVTPDQSILELVEEAGIPITTSCYEGVCGTCEARVLEGIPDHRDAVLNTEQKESGTVMLPCVSRSRSKRLVLDL